VWALFGSLLWILVLVAIFWYPFDFQLDRTFLRERLLLFERVPFYSYYYGTEFRAVTELLHKTLFFLPLGAILAFGRVRMPLSAARTIYRLLAFGILFAVPFGIELGQIALPEKNPSTTDLLLEITGGCIGYFGLLSARRRAQPGD
ncbi:MAG: VanZ family protein, partial [Gammaproteobacteria bacterium]|nr:VanZ family protein [Gammaproteobacteria bacterium]